MRPQLFGIAALLAFVLTAAPASAIPLVSGSPNQVSEGSSPTITISVDPNGTPVGAFNLIFSFSSVSDMSFDSFTCLSGLLCSTSSTGFSVNGEFASAALTTPLDIADVLVTGINVGGQLLLNSGSNFTNFDTFQDIPVGPQVVAEVIAVPEPGTFLLLGSGVLGVLGRRIRRHIQEG